MMDFIYLHEVGDGIYHLDHRLTPEVRAMFASMASRIPAGGIRARYTQIVEAVAEQMLQEKALYRLQQERESFVAQNDDPDALHDDVVAHYDELIQKHHEQPPTIDRDTQDWDEHTVLAEESLTRYPLHAKVQEFFDKFVGMYGHSSIQEQTGDPALYVEGVSWFTNWLLFDSPLVAGQEFSTRAVRRKDWPLCKEAVEPPENLPEMKWVTPALRSLHEDWMKVFEAELEAWKKEFRKACPTCNRKKYVSAYVGYPVTFYPGDEPFDYFVDCPDCDGTGMKYPNFDKEPFRPALDRARWALPGTIASGACFTSNLRERARVLRASQAVGDAPQKVWGEITEGYKKASPGIAPHALRPAPSDYQNPGHLQEILKPVKGVSEEEGVRLITEDCSGFGDYDLYERTRPNTYADPGWNHFIRASLQIECSLAAARDWHRHRTLYPMHLGVALDQGYLSIARDYEVLSEYGREHLSDLLHRSTELYEDYMERGDVQRAALVLPLGTTVVVTASGGYRDVLYSLELRANAHGANFEYKRQAEALLKRFPSD